MLDWKLRIRASESGSKPLNPQAGYSRQPQPSPFIKLPPPLCLTKSHTYARTKSYNTPALFIARLLSPTPNFRSGSSKYPARIRQLGGPFDSQSVQRGLADLVGLAVEPVRWGQLDGSKGGGPRQVG